MKRPHNIKILILIPATPDFLFSEHQIHNLCLTLGVIFHNLAAKSLEVSKMRGKSKKNCEIFWSSIINKGSYEMRFLSQNVNND
jgi:hypothetical protein